jgi:hypothetical protein
MRRTALLALALALLVAGCGETPVRDPRPAPRAAEPQRAELGWNEAYPPGGSEQLRFQVESLEVTDAGWSARIAVTNETSVPFEARPRELERRYGVMLFATGDLAELEEASREGALPKTRPATRIEPEPPAVIAPGATWRALLSAPGALAAGSHVRIVFGPFRAEGEPPEGLEPTVTWITDSSYRLRP